MADSKWRLQIENNVDSIRKELLDLKSELILMSTKDYKIDLGIDSKELESAIKNINKLLTNLSKGSNGFKDFQNFTKQIKEISTYTKTLKDAFGSTFGKNNGLVATINSIDQSLKSLNSTISGNISSFEKVKSSQKDVSNSIDNTNKKLEEQRKKIDSAADAQKKLNGSQASNDGSKKSNASSTRSSSTSAVSNREIAANEEAITTYNQLIAKISEYKRLKTRNLGGSPDLFANDISSAEKLINKINEAIAKLDLTESQLNNATRKINSANNSIANKYRAYANSSNIRVNSNYKRYNSRAQGDSSIDYTVDLKKLEQEYKILGEIIKKIQSEEPIPPDTMMHFEQARAACDEYIRSLQQMNSIQKGSKQVTRAKLLGDIDEYMDKNTRMTKQFRDELTKLKEELSLLGANTDVSSIVSRFEQIKMNVRDAGEEGRRFRDVVQDKAWYGFTQQFATFFGLYDAINIIRMGIDNVIELNTNITELAKVSDASVNQLYDDFSSFSEIAKDVGGTISDTIAATADWARTGYGVEEAKGLAEVSQIYKNVGDGIDISEANESLVSTLKGFQLDDMGDAADQALHIVDVFNEVSNNQAIDSAGIGQALQRSASSFNAANTSL